VARGSHARSYRHRSCLDVRVLRCGRALLTHEPACSCHAAGCMGARGRVPSPRVLWLTVVRFRALSATRTAPFTTTAHVLDRPARDA
jgi:hypothetical protein